MQSLEVISVNIWNILISLGNLLVLFLILKFFLYKPVKKMLAARKEAVGTQYLQAQEALQSAEEEKQLYEKKLQEARLEADAVVAQARSSADIREREIIADAERRAADILQRAYAEIELEKRKSVADMQHVIADLSTQLAQKILNHELNEQEHRALIDSFIAQIGEDDNGYEQ